MDFKQLEAFVYVVKLKSFSKAAQRIYLTQPTISAHINSLEKELDTKLIERGTKYVYPTKPGSILYQYAIKMLNLRDDACCSVKNYNKELKGTLSICASTVPSQYILPKVVSAFREEYPHVTFNIQRQDSELVVENIAKGMADIGFCGTDTHNPDCVFESFIKDHLVIITPNTERFRQMQSSGMKAEFLKNEPIILREDGSGTRKEMEHFLTKAGIDIGELKVAAQFNDRTASSIRSARAWASPSSPKRRWRTMKTSVCCSASTSAVSRWTVTLHRQPQKQPAAFHRRGVSQFREDVLRQIVVTKNHFNFR